MPPTGLYRQSIKEARRVWRERLTKVENAYSRLLNLESSYAEEHRELIKVYRAVLDVLESAPDEMEGTAVTDCLPKRGCGCWCHTVAGVYHAIACCDEPPLSDDVPPVTSDYSPPPELTCPVMEKKGDQPCGEPAERYPLPGGVAQIACPEHRLKFLAILGSLPRLGGA